MWLKFTTVLCVLLACKWVISILNLNLNIIFYLAVFVTWTAAQVTEVAVNATSLPLSRRGLVRNFMSQVQALIANLMKDIEQLAANDGNTINIRT